MSFIQVFREAATSGPSRPDTDLCCLIVGAAVNIVLGVTVGFIVGVAMMLQRAIESESKLPKAKA